jgi:DNA-directed RNA polymerase subunit RPC12/RpoP
MSYRILSPEEAQRLGLKKVWKCIRCGAVFETDWLPRNMIACPKCGERAWLIRVDQNRGWRRGLGWQTRDLIYI